MPILTDIFQRSEKYDPVHPKDPGLTHIFGGLFSKTAAGVSVTPQDAMSITAVYSAVTIISETIAMLPWKLYKSTSTGKDERTNDPRYALINRRPNRYQNSLEYREMMLVNFLLRGRAVAEIIENSAGIITDLMPLHPDELEVFRAPSGKLAYAHEPQNGPERILLSDEVVDFRGVTLDGVECISPIRANEETLGIAKASELYGARYFGNGTVVSGVLESDGALSDNAYKRLQEWTERHQGVGRSHNPAILEEGLKWKTVSVSPEDAQLLETRSYQVEDVARIYRIPAYKLQRMDSVKFNTTEQQAIDFVTDTILPRATRFELAHDNAILSEREQGKLFSEIVLSELLRGDSKARVEFNRGMWNLGAKNANEIRREEGLNAIDGGERYYIPVNVMPSDRVDDMLDSKTRPQPTTMPDDMNRALRPLVRSVLERIYNAELSAETRGKNMVEFYSGHGDFIKRVAGPLIESLATTIERSEVDRYFNDYYVNTMKNFEQRAMVQDENRVDGDTEKLLRWVEGHVIRTASK